jgi:hypothetical protein
LRANTTTSARLLAYVTGLINQELLVQNEYLAAENRILKACLQPGWRLSDGERATLAEIGRRLGRAHYATVRLPTDVHVGFSAHGLLQPARRVFGGGRRWGLPVLARGVSMHAWGLRLRGVL